MTDPTLDRRLAVILMADVVGYSRLMGQDEEGTLLGLQRQRFSVIDPTIGQYRGRIVKSMGDGLLGEFQSVTDAVGCAINIQKSIARQNQNVAEERRISWRMGVNMGEILVRDDDVFGDGVNIAARLQEAADAGGVAVSSTVHANVTPEPDWRIDDLGAHRFKNISQPVRVFHYATDAEAAPSKVAFRPFVDLPQETSDVVATGGCLCGNIRYEATQPPLGSMLCHCKICRHFSGAPILGGTTFLTEALRFTRSEPTYYRSSSIAKRGFCPTCGTAIIYKGLVKQWTKWSMVFTASLDNPADFPPTYHMGIESQLPWLDVHDDLPRSQCKDSPSLVEAYRSVGEDVP